MNQRFFLKAAGTFECSILHIRRPPSQVKCRRSLESNGGQQVGRFLRPSEKTFGSSLRPRSLNRTSIVSCMRWKTWRIMEEELPVARHVAGGRGQPPAQRQQAPPRSKRIPLDLEIKPTASGSAETICPGK